MSFPYQDYHFISIQGKPNEAYVHFLTKWRAIAFSFLKSRNLTKKRGYHNLKIMNFTILTVYNCENFI